MQPVSGCWLWNGGPSGGYGKVTVEQRRIGAHRAAYEAFREPIPAGMEVCHRCDTPPCVNPDHLFLGTRRQNMEDMMKKGRGANQRGRHSSRERAR